MCVINHCLSESILLIIKLDMSLLSSKFKYDVFLTVRDPKDRVKGYVKNKFRDAGITFFVDEEERLSVHGAITWSRIVMALFTPEFLDSEMCLKRLVVSLMSWAHVVPVFCGVSRHQVHEKMHELFATFNVAGNNFLPGITLSLQNSR